MGLPTALTPENAVLVIIDIQGKLSGVINDSEKLVQNCIKLIKGVRVLELPIIMTEQYPAGLGTTLPEISQLIPEVKPIEKLSFSCCGEELFMKAVKAANRKQVLIMGIEAHVCIYQTTMDLTRMGYEVHVVADCTSSRDKNNKKICLKKLGHAGISLTTTEMALFELLKVAKGDKFKQLSKILK